jgi:hypothetical protein
MTDLRTNKVIAIDVEDLAKDERGEKVMNTLLLSSKGMLYRTKRGRLAVQVRPDVFERVKASLHLDVAEGYDGTKTIVFPEPAVTIGFDPAEKTDISVVSHV